MILPWCSKRDLTGVEAKVPDLIGWLSMHSGFLWGGFVVFSLDAQWQGEGQMKVGTVEVWCWVAIHVCFSKNRLLIAQSVVTYNMMLSPARIMTGNVNQIEERHLWRCTLLQQNNKPLKAQQTLKYTKSKHEKRYWIIVDKPPGFGTFERNRLISLLLRRGYCSDWAWMRPLKILGFRGRMVLRTSGDLLKPWALLQHPFFWERDAVGMHSFWMFFSRLSQY